MGLAKSSYTEYSSCRASLLVLIAYSICYRTNQFSDTLRRGLNAIREMASVGDSARSEVSLLEALESALHRLHVFDTVADQTATTAVVDSEQGGYEGFVHWYTKRLPVRQEEDRQHAITQNQELNAPVVPADVACVDSIPDDISMDMYPFDFDWLQTDGNAALFAQKFDENVDRERELFENLFSMPK